MRYEFQIQYSSGNWDTLVVSWDCTDQQVNWGLQDLQKRFPNQRVRCIDENGRLVDIR